MKSIICFLLITLMAAATAMAQPSVAKNGILNAASVAYVGLPNSSIAPGSIFSIYGANLGPTTNPPQTSFPLQTTLGGVSVTVTSGGTSVSAVPVYVGPSQVNAILPSDTPIGSATLTVTYNAQTSAAVPFQVGASSPGIVAINSAGYGPGVITDANPIPNVYGLTYSAHAGDVSIVWATGIGPVQGDEFTGPLPGDMPNLGLEVYVGGVKASVTYRGRSGCCVGEDQIVFTVPQGVLGCRVPVALQIGNVVSNFVTMPIAPPGTNTCSDPGGATTSQLSQFAQQGTVARGDVSLIRSTTTTTLPPPSGTVTSTSDTGSASFLKYNFAQYLTSNAFGVYTTGSCTVIVFRGSSGASSGVIQPSVLDAGSPITVNGPDGSTEQLPKGPSGFYSAQLAGTSGTTTLPPYLNAGTYSVSSAGGNDVGPFSQTLTIFTPLTWTNQDSINTIPRTAGQLVTWSGGDPNSTVVIIGTSFVQGTATDGSDTVGANFVCAAADSAGQFTIPAIVLLSLPASSSQSVGGFTIPAGNLALETISSTPFTAHGIDIGAVSSIVSIGKSLTYQ
jgi:uncharacterized protein (TIGR03437 family)